MTDLNRDRRESRNRIWGEQKSLVDTASAEKRNLTIAEADEYDRRERELVQLDRAIKAAESYAAGGSTVDRIVTPDEARREKAFDGYMRRGIVSPELRSTYDAGMGEAGFQDSGTSGGYMVPQAFWTNLQIAQRLYGGYSQYYKQVPTATGAPMDWPTVDPTSVVGHIIGEGTIDTFQDYVIGQGVLNAWTYTNKLILASVELVNDAAFDVGSFLADRIGEGIGRAEGAHSVSGSGSGQPLGLITALVAGSRTVSLGTATSTNVVGGGTVTELTGNVLAAPTLAKMVSAVDAAYWMPGPGRDGCAWYMSPAQLVAEQNLADGYGRPLYESLLTAEPSLLGFPVRVVAESPVMTASQAGGVVFGDLSVAMVRRVVDHADLMVLRERYADARQIGYYGFSRLDARSNDLRAAVTVLPSSS